MKDKIIHQLEIDEYLMNIIESTEYQEVEYIVYSIRKNFLYYLSGYSKKQFEIPEYLKNLINIISLKFEETHITYDELLAYMLENDKDKGIYYFAYAFIIPASKNEMPDYVKDVKELFFLMLAGYIFETFRPPYIDIARVVANEILQHETNQYGLSVVNDVEFNRDYFVYENKAYMYSLLTNTSVIEFADSMPGFAKIITNNVNSGDVLLRLDERLALPKDQAISYSTLNFEKYYGPQFNFKESILKKQKTITVHIDIESMDKLLMVIKQDYDEKINEEFLHIEIETLPYVENNGESPNCITTFLHGMYYPKRDLFSHIDYTKNQYKREDYLNKYSEATIETPIDFYTEKELHHKIWCIENGEYSREVWYDLMMISLDKKYQTLLDEILA